MANITIPGIGMAVTYPPRCHALLSCVSRASTGLSKCGHGDYAGVMPEGDDHRRIMAKSNHGHVARGLRGFRGFGFQYRCQRRAPETKMAGAGMSKERERPMAC